MTQTQTQLYNLAAQAIGARGKLISTSDKSRYAEVFDTWYDVIRTIVLKSAHWPCAQKAQKLNLHNERALGADWTDTDPIPGARYAYTVPSDFLYPRYLSSFNHFSLGMVGDTQCLFTHQPEPILVYTFDQTNVGKWDGELFLCIAQALGAYTAKGLTGKPALAKQLQAEANGLILQAQTNANNLDQEPTSSVAAWHQARGYIGSGTPARFVFPYGALIAVGESAYVQ